MTENNHFDSAFEGPEPITPPSRAPDLDELRVRLSVRRRQRKIVGASVLGGTFLCLFAFVPWRSGIHPHTGLSASNASVAQQDDSMSQQSPDSLVSTEASLVSTQASGVQVFAKVWRQVPIFGLERETQYFHLVGWIDSEEVVPVDLSQIPREQRESIEAVLNENDTDKYFNL